MKNIFLFVIALSSYSLFAQQDLTVERIHKSAEFRPNYVNGFASLSDGESFTKTIVNNGQSLLYKYQFKNLSGDSSLVMNLSTLSFNGNAIEASDVQLSTSGKYALIFVNWNAIYRRSYSADLYLYDAAKKSISKIHDGDDMQTLPTFSPDETQIAYVAGNNLYNYSIATGKGKQLTKDGRFNSIINGTTDWVYEEEFAITQGFQWSPDSKFLAYMRFDESKVKEFSMAMYGELYPTNYLYKYPKAGEDNSKVTMNIMDITSGVSKPVDLGAYEYIPRFQWSPVKNELVVLTMNRHQNDLNYFLVTNPAAPTSKVFYNEKSPTYIDIDNNLIVLKDGKSLLRTSEKNGWNQLYVLGFDGVQKQITSGNWDIIELYGINEKTNMIYYASAEQGAIHKTLYTINLNGKSKMALSELTGYHSAEFAQGFKYFVKTSSWSSKAPVFTLCDQGGRTIKVLEDNKALQAKLDGMNFVKKEFIQIPGADGTMLNAWVIKPKNFDPAKKYPVYFNVYCGPGSNTVSDEYEGSGYLYHQLLSQKGYIVVSVDPRGTMFRGEAFKKSTYKELGKLETEDIIACGKYFAAQSYVDPARVGIMGWSYGGFMTSLAMTKGADIFKMGIAVAPVTNWRNYDNIYTERFMQTPQENASGYDQNSPVNYADKLKGKFLLIHGSADDNVHYQNSMEFITALVAANKQFDLFIYPNKNHSIYGGNTRNHLYNMMLNYTLENL